MLSRHADAYLEILALELLLYGLPQYGIRLVL